MSLMSLGRVARKRWYRAPSMWLILALLTFASAWLFWQILDRYVQLQNEFSQLSQLPSVTVQLFLPFVQLMAQVAMLLAALLTGAAVAREKQQGTWLYVRDRLPAWVRAQWLAAWPMMLVLFLVVLLAFWCLHQGSQMHWPLVLLALLAWVLFVAWLLTLGLWVSSWSQHSATTTLLTLIVFVLFWMVGQSAAVENYGANWLALLSPQKHFSWLLSGQLSWASVWYFTAGALIFMWLTVRFASSAGRLIHLLVMAWMACVFWLGITVVLARWVPVHSYQISYAALLPDAAKQLLAQQDDLTIDVFAEPESQAAFKVSEFLSPLFSEALSGKGGGQVNYLSPAEHVETMAQLGLSAQGSMRVTQDDAFFVMKSLSYEQFFNGLKKLQVPKDQWVVLLNGFDSADYHDESESGFSQWFLAMKQAGYAVAIMDWQAGLNMPSNVTAVIINQPRAAWSQEAVEWLQQQVQSGVSLWWLTNPEQLKSQDQLSLLFDAMPAEKYHAGRMVLKSFPDHDINQAFDRPLDLNQVALFETASDVVWATPQGDVLAASQELDQARLLVVGDSDYLSNERLLSGGNLEMSYRQLDWLLWVESRIDLPTIGLAQSQVQLTGKQVLTFSVLMLIVLPGLLLLLAIKVWYRNRR